MQALDRLSQFDIALIRADRADPSGAGLSEGLLVVAVARAAHGGTAGDHHDDFSAPKQEVRLETGFDATVFNAQAGSLDELAETLAARILLISVAEYRHEDLKLGGSPSFTSKARRKTPLHR